MASMSRTAGTEEDPGVGFALLPPVAGSSALLGSGSRCLLLDDPNRHAFRAFYEVIGDVMMKHLFEPWERRPTHDDGLAFVRFCGVEDIFHM